MVPFYISTHEGAASLSALSSDEPSRRCSKTLAIFPEAGETPSMLSEKGTPRQQKRQR